MLAKWNGKVNCLELFVELTLVGLLPTVKDCLWNMAKTPNSRVKLNSTLAPSFQQQPCWEMDVIPNVNFALSSNNKDQLRDLYNYLNRRVITVFNTLDGSTLGGNLIMSHQVDYMSQCSFQVNLLKMTKSKSIL